MLVCRGTSYSTLLSIVLKKMTLYQKDYDIKLKTLLSPTPKEKFLHTIDSNDDQEVTFDKYMPGVIHIVTIYVERKDKYILMR